MDNSKLRLDREQELKTIDIMMRIYCKGQKHERNGQTLCNECQELLDYARARSERCPRKEEKTFCNTCPIHCYKPVYREEIKKVMRYSGPRLLYRHPVIAVKHMVNTIKNK